MFLLVFVPWDTAPVTALFLFSECVGYTYCQTGNGVAMKKISAGYDPRTTGGQEHDPEMMPQDQLSFPDKQFE